MATLNRKAIPRASYELHKIKLIRLFPEATREAGVARVDAILDRGNFASMKNIAGKFFVKELVMQ